MESIGSNRTQRQGEIVHPNESFSEGPLKSQGLEKPREPNGNPGNFHTIQCEHMGMGLFDFAKAGLNGHGDRIKEIYDLTNPNNIIKEDDYEIFRSVFHNLRSYSLHTIEGAIYHRFLMIYQILLVVNIHPFTEDQVFNLSQIIKD